MWLAPEPVFSAVPRAIPKQLVPRLADEGIYLASESTMYRLLRIQPRSTRISRGSTRAVSGSAPLVITAPNRAWSWDITRLKVPTQASYLYLYLIMNVFSRRIMGGRYMKWNPRSLPPLSFNALARPMPLTHAA